MAACVLNVLYIEYFLVWLKLFNVFVFYYASTEVRSFFFFFTTYQH